MKILYKNTKARNQYKHTQRRFKQRYAIRLSKDEYIAMCAQVRKNKARFIKRVSNRVTLFWVEFEDMEYPVVYDRQRKTIATVLLRSHLQLNDND